MKIIKFIGYSSSGKTTLIEKIVKKLTDDGIRVATIKHDVHGLDIDKEGKDSYRYSQAGAKISIVSSPELTVYKLHKPLSLNEIISKIDDVDIIIVEGYSIEDGIPTIEVSRKATGKGFKCDLKNVIAVISDYDKNELSKIGYTRELFDIDDLENIIIFIKTKILKK